MCTGIQVAGDWDNVKNLQLDYTSMQALVPGQLPVEYLPAKVSVHVKLGPATAYLRRQIMLNTMLDLVVLTVHMIAPELPGLADIARLPSGAEWFRTRLLAQYQCITEVLELELVCFS